MARGQSNQKIKRRERRGGKSETTKYLTSAPAMTLRAR